MIIFDLDGTLADCEHRRHFVVKNVACDHWYKIPGHPVDMCEDCKLKHINWKTDWKAFYEACDQDKPIEPTIEIFSFFATEINEKQSQKIQIWSGRCESVRKKTEDWLFKHIPNYALWFDLKMRPLGDNTPEELLKERWLEDLFEDTKWGRRHPIKFVFDDDPRVITMWRKWGIFVFDINQTGKEF